MKAIMFAGMSKAVINCSKQQFHQNGMCRLRTTVVSFVVVFLLSACGGGGGGGDQAVKSFNIEVTVGGQLLSNTPVNPGGSLNLAIHAGQSLVLASGEPAVWTLFVGGNAISTGVQVYYAGANITASTLNLEAVAVDTYAAYPLQASIPITLIATSSYDSVNVATVNLLITN